MRYKIIPVFIPHASCPNQCIFCNQREITSVSGYDYDSVKNTIAECVATFSDDNALREIAFYGGSFTAIESDVQEKFLSIAKGYIDSGDIESIRISTRPDSIDTETLDRLKRYGVKTIELGIQSMSDDVLDANDRGQTRADSVRASKLIKEHGFTLGHQIMPGLYKDTPEAMLQTADECIELKPEFMRVYPCLVVKGTDLAKLYESGEYVPLTIDEAVDICKDIYKKAARAGVTIIRMGLHPERDFVESGIVAGPFHPSFKHLVISALFYDLIARLLGSLDLNGEDLVILVNKSDVSNATGIKKSNIVRIREKFSLKSVKVTADENIKEGSVTLSYDKVTLSAGILDVR